MDRETAKALLECYRPGDLDADDPIFAEALALVKTDAELAEWFAKKQEFDALMVERFREHPRGSSAGKEAILAGVRARAAGTSHGAETGVALAVPSRPAGALGPAHAAPAEPPPGNVIRLTWPRAILAIAAVFVAALLLANFFSRPKPLTPAQLLAQQGITYTSSMPALQMVCFDASVVARWVSERPGFTAADFAITKTPENMRLIGASVAEWQGKPVIMLSLQNDRQMAMFYLVRGDDFALPPETDYVEEKDGWVSKVIRTGGHAGVLTTKGTRDDLKFDMPF